MVRKDELCCCIVVVLVYTLLTVMEFDVKKEIFLFIIVKYFYFYNGKIFPLSRKSVEAGKKVS